MARKAARHLGPEDKTRRTRRLLGLGCLGLVALGIIIIAVIGLQLRSGPALPRGVRERVQQQEASGSAGGPSGAGITVGAAASRPSALPAGTPSLPQQMQQVAYAGQAGDTRPQKLYVTDAELNQMIATSINSSGKLKRASAYFGSGKAFLVAVADWRGSELAVTVRAEPVIVNGGLQFGVEDVRIGSFPAPSAVTERIQKEFSKNSGRFDPAKTGLYIENVEIKEGMAVLSGRAVRPGG